MAVTWADKKFSKEYKIAKDHAKKDWSDPVKFPMTLLAGLFMDKGFNPQSGAKLVALRNAVKDDEFTKIMQGAGIDPTSANTNTLSTEKLCMAATLKLLRHTYVIHERGAQKVWLVSTPKSYRNYPSAELDAAKTSRDTLKGRFAAEDEFFSKNDKKNLASATNVALGWINKTLAALSKAKADTSSDEMTQVKLWFGAGADDDADKATVVKLQNGFKKMANTINSNQIIYTDVPHFRNGAAGTDEGTWWKVYAFVFPGWSEGIPVIYIESAFFDTAYVKPISNESFWAQTVVHELSHLDVSTTDVRYYHQGGLKIQTGFTGAQALTNADSWGWYCVDAAKGMTEQQRNKVLNYPGTA